ncbi:MAG: hypothetical protein KGQ56_02320 [Acidobacteria bacterium]|nr:hypothetical protein [Acidobacteriota bacterium]NDC47665.1 hypothetical protein [Micrococcales bacterium]
MPRNNRPKKAKRSSEDEPSDLEHVRSGIARTEIKNGIEFTVQTTSGRTAEQTKRWICPFCNQSFGPGISHIVAWETDGGTDKRRHFHTNCWAKFQGRLF